MVPGGFFAKPDGTDSEIGNLHLGIFKAGNARPHPEPASVEPRALSTEGRKPRIWVLISDDDSADRILYRRRARRDPAVARPLLVGIQRLQPRLPRSVGQ
jgi:hypothetical protein